jgi:hypothetical protein
MTYSNQTVNNPSALLTTAQKLQLVNEINEDRSRIEYNENLLRLDDDARFNLDMVEMFDENDRKYKFI